MKYTPRLCNILAKGVSPKLSFQEVQETEQKVNYTKKKQSDNSRMWDSLWDNCLTCLWGGEMGGTWMDFCFKKNKKQQNAMPEHY